MRTWLCALLLLFAATVPSWAASRAETRAFEAAARSFRDGIWERADRELGEFVQAFPKSERRAEAILLRAQSRCKMANYAGAIQLLSAEQGGAGPRADEFLFWLGEAQYQSTNYPAAAAAFRAVANDFPASKLRLDASVNEAAAWARLADWDRVIELLSQPASVFQQLVKTAATSSPAARGVLLLAEAQLARERFAVAEQVLRPLEAAKLDAALAWQREFLLCRALLGSRRPEMALQMTSNLLALARSLARPVLQAQSVALQATAFEELGQLENSAAAYSQNMTPEAPVELQRQALLKVGELALARGRLNDAAQAMEQYLQRHSNSPACDMALLTLGEMQLRQYVTSPGTNAANTNWLPLALASLDALRERFPQSALLGRMQLNRGWCLALSSNLTESAAAFAAAADALPAGFDQATARFKLADAQYQQQQFTAALSNYSRVVADADAFPAVKASLCEPALYQMVRASVEAGDPASANTAAGRILAWFPEGYLTAPSLLLAGQGLARHGDPAAARRIFEDFVKRFPDSPRTPEVRLAIARTHGLQQNWPAAAQEYRAWLTAYPTNAELPRAQFELALAAYWAKDDTNAIVLLTDFLAQFPTNTFAPQARWWVASYHFRKGAFVEAEKNYQLLIQSWPGSALAPEAGMMAGRAAMAREVWLDGLGYFTNLTSSLNWTNPLWTQAMFAYGEALRRIESPDTNNPLANFNEAIKVYAKIHQLHPTNATAARAWGEIGKCYLQLATRDSHQYTNASHAFRQVVNAPWADAAARGEALVALGLVAERLAELKSGNEQAAGLREALDCYLDVFYENGKYLRDGERADPFWQKEAGLKAAKLLETLQGRPAAEKIYEELIRRFPPLQPFFEKKLKKGA